MDNKEKEIKDNLLDENKNNKENSTNIIQNIVEEKNSLINKTNNINENINSNILLSNDENIMNTNNIINQKMENNKEIIDYFITIQYSKLLHIPYFKFGNIFHFYFPCKHFTSNQIKLSEMPTPPFAVIRSECK